jgi:hypothetical protein
MPTSPTFEKIIDWMDIRIEKDLNGTGEYIMYSAPKLVMFSSHDTTLTAMQIFMKKGLNITDYYYPSYASSIYFELK